MESNFVTIFLGFVIVLFGAYNLYLRMKKPEVYQVALDAVKRSFGDKVGAILHTFSRVVLPLIVGVLTIVLGFMGQSILS